MEIGGKIKKLRLDKGWTQEDLAKKLNCSINAISQYEKGKRSPDIEAIKKLSKIFEVDANQLIFDSPEEIHQFNELMNDVDKELSRADEVIQQTKDRLMDIHTKYSYTMTLLRALVENGAINDPTDIKEKFLDKLVSMLEMDVEELINDNKD